MRPYRNHLLLAVSFASMLLAGNPALARAENSVSGSYLAARAATTNRDTPQATLFYQSVLENDPENTVILDRTFRLALASNAIPEALALARRLVRQDEHNRLARLALAIDAVKQGKFKTARFQLGRSQQTAAPDVVATLIAAWTWNGSGAPSQGLAILDKLEGNDLAELFRDLHAGMLAGIAKRNKEATRRLEQAYRLDQSSFVVVDAYARQMARVGRRDDALKAYRLLEANAPRNARIVQSIAALEKGVTPPALVTNTREGIAEALFGFGQLANRSDTAEVAQAYLNLTLYLEPNHELALLTLADLYENLNQPANAVEIYKKIPQRSIFARDVALRIAVNLALLEKPDEAIATLDRLLKVEPDNIDAIMTLGNLAHRQKDYPRAAEVFSKAIALIDTPTKTNWAVYFARAVAYDGAKNWEKAEADLLKAHSLDGEQPILLNYLGYSWVDRNMHLDKALGMIRKAVELRPNDGDIVDSLGWAFYKIGKYDEAVSALERAVELKPQSWELNDHLGDVYWRVERKLEAKFQWLHALSLEPDADKRDAIALKIKQGLPEAADKTSNNPKPSTTTPAPQAPKTDTVPAAPAVEGEHNTSAPEPENKKPAPPAAAPEKDAAPEQQPENKQGNQAP